MAYSNLDSLGYIDQRGRCAEQKSALKTRLDVKAAADKQDTRKLEVWRGLVYARDKFTCRCCGVKVIRTLNLDPKRAEAHHVKRRDELAVRYDVRNGLTLCLSCHQKVTHYLLRIIATKFFMKGKTRYVNASAPVMFKPKEAA